VDKAHKNWLPWQRPLKNRKTNFRLFIYNQSSTNLENVAKISHADVDIIGLTEIVKNKYKNINKKPRQSTGSHSGGLKSALVSGTTLLPFGAFRCFTDLLAESTKTHISSKTPA